MSKARVGLCTIEFAFEGLTSLKEKRSILKSLLSRLHNQFNASAAEVDQLDSLSSGVIGVAVVTNDSRHANQMLDTILDWIERNYPDAVIVDQELEIL